MLQKLEALGMRNYFNSHFIRYGHYEKSAKMLDSIFIQYPISYKLGGFFLFFAEEIKIKERLEILMRQVRDLKEKSLKPVYSRNVRFSST